MAGPKRTRLDQALVAAGLAPSRNRAQALILAGKVLVNGDPVTKAGQQVPTTATLTLKEPDHGYVSRGGVKLAGALDAFGWDPTGRSVLDVGASTGGFTDCLLQRGARHVIAVDVGYGQLAWRLRNDPRVTCVERTNARHLKAAELQQAAAGAEEAWPPRLATLDVSFISLTLVLPAIRAMLSPGDPLVALVKPQFEAARAHVGKGGVVRDPEHRQAAIDKVLGWAADNGLCVAGTVTSSVAGPKGNVEELALLRVV